MINKSIINGILLKELRRRYIEHGSQAFGKNRRSKAFMGTSLQGPRT